MIRTRKLIFLLPLFLAALLLILTVREQVYKAPSLGFGIKTKGLLQDFAGEKIVYDVRMGRLRLGKAEFNNVGSVEKEGKKLYLMTMLTEVTQFKDLEKIYSDPKTFLPVKVERDIAKLIMREKITELYDQEKFVLKITKEKGESKEEKIITRNGPIHNAVLLPFYVRHINGLKTGKVITANLPNRAYQIKLISVEEIKVPGGTFQAFHFTSTPRQMEIWISADEYRIPLKIQGTGLFGYSLLMSEYSKPGAKEEPPKPSAADETAPAAPAPGDNPGNKGTE
ncbi:MAG: DUF3108 domain-containing protein [Candidatus Omnitrophica bacterium]|nr:DUF3108 domain-containing protein [Candidatus Omnitrophota bacterium]